MHFDEKSIHDLIGAIYDGVADPASWQHALVRLSDATHSVGAFLIARDRAHPRQSQCILARVDPDLNQLFLTRYAKDCPWTRVADRTPAGNVYAGDAAVPARELIKTEFYAEILRPQQVLHEGAAILARDPSRLVGLSIFRSAKIGHIDSEDLRLLSLVAPHFKRASQIAWRLATHAAPGVTHRWTNMTAFTEEVANARIWAGFHYRFSTRMGTQMGLQIGEQWRKTSCSRCDRFCYRRSALPQ